MNLCAVRGAITLTENNREAILQASGEMLLALVEANDIRARDVVAATFSATPDLDAAYPAEAARDLGWRDAGLLCLQEMVVQGSLPMCLRVRVLWKTEKKQAEISHQYLRGAAVLRPDLVPSQRD
jgi:chorismate mutase